MKKAFPLVLLLLSLSVNHLLAQGKGDPVAVKMDALFKKYNNSTGPGCTVAVIKDGKVIFKKGYGMANLEYGIPITTASIFDIASLSKQFTGLVISMLEEKGKINVDDDIHKYLPDVPDFGRIITVKHLLHHTSGLRDWPEALATAGWSYEEEASFADIMHMVKHQKDLDFEPGSEYSYSNTGYNLLAAIVEKVSGKTFRQFTDSAIFKPLGMNASHFLDDKGTVVPNLAYSYYQDDHKNWVKVINVLTAYGSSSLYTSTDDLCKWVINFQKALAARDPLYIRMLGDYKLNNGKDLNYGYGLQRDTDKGLKTISHTGGWAAYRTHIMNYPDEKFSFITLCNANDNEISGGYADSIANLFLKSNFKSRVLKVAQLRLPLVKADTVLLKKYAGLYKWKSGEVTISTDKDTLFFRYHGEDQYPTKALSDSSFFLDIAGLPVTFLKPVNGVVSSFTFRSVRSERITPYTPTLAELDQYTGTFYSSELDAEYKIDVKNGKLVIHHFRRGDFDLSGDVKDEFSSDIGNIRFVKNNDGKIAGFKLSGGRVRNLAFDKTQ